MSDDEGGEPIGYGRPPRSTRFQKGMSGNAKGRPRGRKTTGIPYDSVLGQMVTIREEGIEKKVTVAEAFLLQLTKQGLEGQPAAIKAILSAIQHRKSSGPNRGHNGKATFVINFITPGNPNWALLPLRMARKLDAFRPTARIVLEPWLVEAALARLGDRRLTSDEQLTVVKAARTPHKVKWPEWWTVGP
jgi:Family of unknown function (DUF5681)